MKKYNGWSNWETWNFNLWVDEYLYIELEELYKEAYNSLQLGGEFGDFTDLEELERVNLEEIKRNREEEYLIEKTTREVLEELSNCWLDMIERDESKNILKDILIQGFGGFSNSSYGDLEVEYEETFGKKIKII